MKKNTFNEIEDKNQKAPKELKDMVVSEVNIIRNVLEIVTIYLGMPFEVFKKIMQE